VKAILDARPRYIRFAQSILNNLQDAEDVVQDCYIRLYERNDEQEIRNREAYMMQAVRNACLDLLKKKRPEELEDRHEQLSAAQADVLRKMESQEHARRLQQLIRLLPEKQRTAFYLRDVEGYEMNEIETVTGLSNEAIRSALCRARKQLRDLYNQLK